MPYSYVAQQNPIYSAAGLDVNHEKAKFQFSFRFPLSSTDLFVKGDGLDIGYTQVSFWQVYNSESAPFRETNYDPEVYYPMPLNFRPHGADTALRFGLEHESNGRGIVNGYTLSRSWNRVYAKLIYAKDDYVIAQHPGTGSWSGPRAHRPTRAAMTTRTSRNTSATLISAAPGNASRSNSRCWPGTSCAPATTLAPSSSA